MIDEQSDISEARRKGIMTKERALADFNWAVEYKAKIIKEMDKDFEFALGAQWDDEDAKKLEEVGVLPITINEIAPIVDLLYGIESQGRSEIRAYPEGQEDSIKAEITTRLLKNAMQKHADADYKISETFTNGNICGEAWLEPYLDYSKNLIVADLKLKCSDHTQFFWDPYAKEYDLSDAAFLDKLTRDLSQDQILMLYPEAEKQLKNAAGGHLIQQPTMGATNAMGEHIQPLDYGDREGSGDFQWQRQGEKTFDLLEHYYKKYVDVWYVIDNKTGRIVRADNEQEAKGYVETVTAQEPEGQESAAALKRKVPEIWMMAIVAGCDKPVADEPVWSYPTWNNWPSIPYFPRRIIARMKDSKRHLTIQGLTRQLKDLNREKNKRRTQALRHLNQSANSGWLSEENSWVDPDEVKKFGSAPGADLQYKTGKQMPQRILPAPLSQGHEQMAAEASEDIKRVSGINADLLAAQEGGSDSGRAIALRQKQGLVMVQRYFDSMSRTKKILARFVLSQLPQIYTMERAMRVCGESFLQMNFQKPRMMPIINPQTGQPVIDPATGQPAMQPVIDPTTGQPVMEYDQQAAQQAFLGVLNDKDLLEYDVAVGEVVSRETVEYANYLLLTEMAQSGLPIPPDVLVDESSLPVATKAKIKSAIQNAQLAAAKAPPKK